MDSTKLVQYTHAARRLYLKALSELPWEEVVKDRGASFPSLRDIFLHALDAEDMLVNYVIPGRLGECVTPDHDSFTNVDQIQQRMDRVEKRVNAYLAALTGTELDRKVILPWRKDPPLMIRVEDVLVSVAIEDASHMGELIALMWQFDKQPPYLGWSAFLEQSS